MKLVDTKTNTYIDSNKEINDKDVNSKMVILGYQNINIFATGYTPNWSEEVFGIKKVKNTALWIYAPNDINRKEIVRTLYEKELQKTNQKKFRIEKKDQEKRRYIIR